MKLQELAAYKTPRHYVNHVFESHFKQVVDFEKIDARQANKMLSKVQKLIREHRATTDRHFNEQNPSYLKLIMMEQALKSRVEEQVPATSTGGVTGQQQAAQTAQTAQTIATTKDPKMRAALQKVAKGQTLTPDEQKMVGAAALMKTEGTLRRAFKVIKESEVQQAQVVLAAQDMVDNIQGMIEDATEMQFKELPALVDSIRNQIGMDQAVQFQQDATAALTGLVQSLQGTKTSLEQGLGVVTGQSQMAPGIDAAMGGEPPMGAEPPMEPGADGEEEIDLSLDANIDEPEEEPAGGRLGRERR
jgi:cysteinyl-tRNA synthetase